MNRLVSYLHITTASGSTPLHYAALRKDVRFIEFLLQKGVCVDVRNCFMETPLHWAVKQGHMEIVMLLLSSGAQLDALDTESLSPRDWAIDEDQPHLLPLLRRRRDPSS